MQTLVLLLGLILAAWGHAILHDWRGAAALWDRLEQPFPLEFRSPPSLAGGTLLATGWVFAAAPIVG